MSETLDTPDQADLTVQIQPWHTTVLIGPYPVAPGDPSDVLLGASLPAVFRRGGLQPAAGGEGGGGAHSRRSGTNAAVPAPAAPATSHQRLTVSPALAGPRERGGVVGGDCSLLLGVGVGGRPVHCTAASL